MDLDSSSSHMHSASTSMDFNFGLNDLNSNHTLDSESLMPSSSIGIKYFYWNSFINHSWYIQTHKSYNDLKEEIIQNISNTISVQDWNLFYEKAVLYLKCNYAKKIIHKCDGESMYNVEYSIAKDSLITIQHMICILIYTNSLHFQKQYKSTFYYKSISNIILEEKCEEENVGNEEKKCEDDDELNIKHLSSGNLPSPESILNNSRKRHAKYAHFSRYLQEAIQCFGIQTMKSPLQTFYHGFDFDTAVNANIRDNFMILNYQYMNIFIQPSFVTSSICTAAYYLLGNTTARLNRSALVNNNSSGYGLRFENQCELCLELKRNDNNLRFLDCSFLCDFTVFEQQLLFSNANMQQTIYVNSIFDNKEFCNYQPYFGTLQYMQQLIAGVSPTVPLRFAFYFVEKLENVCV